MIPTLQLDPASLSLWFNADVLNTYKNESHGLEIFTHTANGDISKTYPILDGAETDAHRAHYYELMSAVWHEKRHFLDFILTNYGAFQVRTFFQLYNNLGPLCKIFKNFASVYLPIDVYDDPVRLFALGETAIIPDEVQRVARWLSNRKDGMEGDTVLLDLGRGLTDYGGIAQMEALAYSCQLAVLQYELGTDSIELLNKYSPLPMIANRRYAWARDFWTSRPDPTRPPHFKTVNVDRMMALMVASLCGKMFVVPGEEPAPIEWTAPSLRLARLITLPDWKKSQGASIEEVWEIINKGAKRLWGRSVNEELDEDFNIEEKLLDNLKAEHGSSLVTNSFEEYHRLRRIVINDLKQCPANYISSQGFFQILLDGLSPLQVICSPSGQPSSVDAKVLFGYEMSGAVAHQEPTNGWYAILNPGAENDEECKIAIKEDSGWEAIIAEFAPVGKLLVSGRRSRVMLGAELVRGEEILRKVGLKIKYRPFYNLPYEDVDITAYERLTGRDTIKCDFTGAILPIIDCCFISPWEIKENEDFMKYVMSLMDSPHIAPALIARDWSFWITSRQLADELRTRFGLPKPGRQPFEEKWD